MHTQEIRFKKIICKEKDSLCKADVINVNKIFKKIDFTTYFVISDGGAFF